MGIVNGISVVNNLIAGSMSGAQLQTYLATGANLASFVQVTNVRRQLQVLRNTPAAVTAVMASSTALAQVGNNELALRVWALYGTSYNWRSFAGLAALFASAPAMAEVAASSVAMAPIIASNAAMTAAAASSAAMAAIAASPTAMAALAASSSAMAIVVASSTAMTALVASSGAMSAIAASPAAMAALAASSSAMVTVAASSTAMTALAASSSAMSAVAASSAAKMAIFGDDTALAAIAGSNTALTALRSAAGYAVSSAASSTSAQSIPGATAGGSYVLLGVSCSSSGSITITSITTRRSGSARPNTASVPSTGTNAAVTTMCTPLVSPFNWTSNSTGQTWYFGLLRCDV